MTPDTIAIIAVGVGLGGLMLTLFQLTNRRIDSLERRFDSLDRRIDSLGARIDSLEGRVDSLHHQQLGFAERQSRLEGLMEAIRDMLMRSPTPP